MWTDWRPERVDADLARVASLNANTVRAIIEPFVFGYPHPSTTYTSRLSQFVSLAAAHGLHVQLTLFDWWYEWLDISGSKIWVDQLLSPYANDPRIAFVELRNEIATVPPTYPWARRMIPFVKEVVGGSTPVTLSVSGKDVPARLEALKRGLGSVRPDFWDIHSYPGGGESMYHLIRRAQSVAGSMRLWIGETGYPTTTVVTGYGGVPRTVSGQEAAQAHFFATVSWAAKATGLPRVGVWVLDDMVPSAVPDRPVDELDPELHFGLFRLDGSAKPGAEVVRTVFSARPPVSFNEGFEQSVTSESGASVPAQWSMTGDAEFAQDTSVANEGKSSVRVAPRRAGATASVSIVPPNAGVGEGTRLGARAWARRAADGGDVFLVLEWCNASGRTLGHRGSKPLSAAPGQWGKLRVGGRAPRDAAFPRIELVVRNTTSPVWFDRVSFNR